MTKKATLVLPTKEEVPSDILTITKADLEAIIAKAIAASSQAKADSTLFNDPTMNEPTGILPASLVADKTALPPPEARQSAPVQPAAKLWGVHIAPSPLQTPAPVGVVDPRTGNQFNQVMPKGGNISPPPSRNFR